MDQQTFESNLTLLSTEYRAYCKEKNRHWTGKWRDSYSSAKDDADAHRKNNAMHDIKIEQRTYGEASV